MMFATLFWFLACNESNRIESNRLVCGTESNRIVLFFAESPITILIQCSLANMVLQGSSALLSDIKMFTAHKRTVV